MTSDVDFTVAIDGKPVPRCLAVQENRLGALAIAYGLDELIALQATFTCVWVQRVQGMRPPALGAGASGTVYLVTVLATAHVTETWHAP